MSRELTSGMQSAIGAATLRPAILFEGNFITDSLRLWTGVGDLSWDSKTWLGNGWLQGIGDVQEQEEINASSFDVLLVGVPLALVSLILGEVTHASTGSAWIVLLDSSNAVISDPYMLWTGTLSIPKLNDSPDGSQIILTFVDELVNLQKESELRYNNASQTTIFPGDRGFEYVAGLANISSFFGFKEKPPPPQNSKKGRSKK